LERRSRTACEENPNGVRITPACYRAEKFIKDSTLGETANSMDLQLMRISCFEEQLAHNGDPSAEDDHLHTGGRPR
jgi:hypothetical protein